MGMPQGVAALLLFTCLAKKENDMKFLDSMTAEVTNNSNVSQVEDLNSYLSVMYRKETDKFARVGASIVFADKVAIVTKFVKGDKETKTGEKFQNAVWTVCDEAEAEGIFTKVGIVRRDGEPKQRGPLLKTLMLTKDARPCPQQA
jgi:hypothetical protein